jgi:hypothetical protein
MPGSGVMDGSGYMGGVVALFVLGAGGGAEAEFGGDLGGAFAGFGGGGDVELGLDGLVAGLGCLVPGSLDVAADCLEELAVPLAGQAGQVGGGLAFLPWAGERDRLVWRGRCRGQLFYLVLGGALGFGGCLHAGVGRVPVGAQ